MSSVSFTVQARRRSLALADRAVPFLSVIGVLVLFELLSRTGALPSRYFPPMTDNLAELAELLVDSAFWTAVGQTLEGWALGLGIAVALAIPLGILIGASETLYRSFRVLIEFLRPIPSVALIPFAVLVYGVGLKSKVFLVSFAAFWPLLIQAIYGVQNVDTVASDTARVFGFGRVQRLVRVSLPSAAPYIATGIRISSTVALVLAVTAELVIGSPGLGRSIELARTANDTTLMFALTIATGLIGWILNAVTSRGERRLLRWHEAYRKDD